MAKIFWRSSLERTQCLTIKPPTESEDFSPGRSQAETSDKKSGTSDTAEGSLARIQEHRELGFQHDLYQTQ